MKRIMLALVALLSLAAQVAYPYAIMNDKTSDGPVTVYVIAGFDREKYAKYLRARDIPDDVIKGATGVAGATPIIAGALAAPTGGVSLAVGAGVEIGVGAAAGIVKALQESGFMDEWIKKEAGIIATHRNVMPGNNTEPDKNRSAEYGWEEIQKEYGLPRGSQLIFVFTAGENDRKVLLTAGYPSDGKFGVKVSKDATGNLVAQRSYKAEEEYVPSSIQSTPESWWERARNVLERNSGIGGFFGSLKDTAVSTYEQVNKSGDDVAKQQADLAKQQAELIKSQNTKLNK